MKTGFLPLESLSNAVRQPWLLTGPRRIPSTANQTLGWKLRHLNSAQPAYTSFLLAFPNNTPPESGSQRSPGYLLTSVFTSRAGRFTGSSTTSEVLTGNPDTGASSHPRVLNVGKPILLRFISFHALRWGNTQKTCLPMIPKRKASEN